MTTTEDVLVIAEAGVNHNGDLELAKDLIYAASEAGADVVKFQSFQPDQLATPLAAQADYQKQALGESQSQLKMLKKLALDLNQHLQLIDCCKKCNIEFLSSAFDLSSLDLLKSFDLQRWKIPSGEITNLPYLRRIGSFSNPILLSTGMASLGEIEASLSILEDAGTPRDLITVLHCTTEYPAPPQEVNLRAMITIARSFSVSVGYSDHTAGIEVPLAAVAMGAKVIEKHITLDRNLPGPDHKASLEPHEFASMVKGIRIIQQALGDGIKRPTLSEHANLPNVRKSLVAARPIRAGELFSEANLTAKRPGTGISPMEWDTWISRPASRDFAADEAIS